MLPEDASALPALSILSSQLRSASWLTHTWIDYETIGTYAASSGDDFKPCPASTTRCDDKHLSLYWVAIQPAGQCAHCIVYDILRGGDRFQSGVPIRSIGSAK